jgi:hypothetical protein
LPSYISWKEDNSNYLIQRVGAFLLSSPDHFREYRKQVRNILDWGKDKRPKQIGDALDIILEEQEKAAERGKVRPPPWETSCGHGRGRGSCSTDDSASSRAQKSHHNQVLDAIQDFQSSHYREHDAHQA